jgi:hypothetical protein
MDLKLLATVFATVFLAELGVLAGTFVSSHVPVKYLSYAAWTLWRA